MYAIISHGGRQYRVSAGDRLLVDRLEAEVGSVIALEPVLLTGGDGTTELGERVEGVRVAAIVLSHCRGPKLRIFKYKAKKRYRRAAGYRSDLTEVRIDSILARGEALPEATAGAPRRAPAGKPTTPRKSTPRKATARTSPATKATATKPAAAKPAAAKPATTKPAATKAAAAKPAATKPAATKSVAGKAVATKPAAGRAAPVKSAPTAKADAPADEEESGDGT